jgi:ATP-dependent helicase/nuclease subunit B
MAGRTERGAASGRPPAVYSIAPELPFVDVLAAGLLARAGDDPAALARTLVLLPTRRACRALQEAFLRRRGGAGLLLPRLQPLGDVDEDELLLTAGDAPLAGDDLDVPPAVAPLSRLLLLARLVAEDAGAGAGADPATAVRLAESLADLLDGAAIAEISLDRLDRLVPEEFAAHWQTTLDFLAILRERWPRLLADRGEIDLIERRLRLLRTLAARWRTAPPAHPVIAAGSTGSIPATADLLGVVARLAAGEVVLPGLDSTLDERSWTEAGKDATHPQHALHGLLERIGVAREAVRPWDVPAIAPASSARVRLIAEALRPAETTGDWLALKPPPDAAFAGVTRIDAASPRDEAGAIALRLREALEAPGRIAALVTPDRALARRVAAELRRWDIEVDDSAGTPLAATPPGGFLRLVAAAAAERLAPVALLALLKHPLAAGGVAPGAFREQARRLERAVLRGPRPAPDVAGLRAALAQTQGEAGGDLARWLDGLEHRVAPLADMMARATAPLGDLLRAHLSAAEALAASDAETGAARLWAGEAGEAAATFIAEAVAAAEALPPLSPGRYPALFETLMAGRVVRPRYGRHPRVHIWGPLEARLQRADLMILGGLNEGTWPPEPAEDPWLSRPMRQALGLPPPEFRTGLAAHDFAQACAAPEIVLTRASKVEGTPTVASRWLLRLDALLANDKRWAATLDARPLAWHRFLDEPAEAPRPVPPPRPCPPVAARPRKLSVTAVESWIRDPYAIFARRILRLEQLDPLDADPGVLERGLMIHHALDRFLRDHRETLPEDALARLLDHGRATFGPWLDRPAVRAFWWPRFRRIADWFVDFERARRAAGMHTLATEVRGERRIAARAGDFTLTCIADRVDLTPDGALAILDYKTGTVPSARQVDSGLSPQLPLEAAIALAGGLENIAARAVGELAYVKLSGGRDAGDYKPVEVRRDGTAIVPEALAAQALEGLARRIARFDDPATPYLSRPHPQWLSRAGDYDHLARVREWSAAFGREDA